MAVKAPKDDFVTVKLRRVDAETLKNTVGGTPAQAIRKLITKAQAEQDALDVADAVAARKGRSYTLDELESAYGLRGGSVAGGKKGTRQAAEKRAKKAD